MAIVFQKFDRTDLPAESLSVSHSSGSYVTGIKKPMETSLTNEVFLAGVRFIFTRATRYRAIEIEGSCKQFVKSVVINRSRQLDSAKFLREISRSRRLVSSNLDPLERFSGRTSVSKRFYAADLLEIFDLSRGEQRLLPENRILRR